MKNAKDCLGKGRWPRQPLKPGLVEVLFDGEQSDKKGVPSVRKAWPVGDLICCGPKVHQAPKGGCLCYVAETCQYAPDVASFAPGEKGVGEGTWVRQALGKKGHLTGAMEDPGSGGGRSRSWAETVAFQKGDPFSRIRQDSLPFLTRVSRISELRDSEYEQR